MSQEEHQHIAGVKQKKVDVFRNSRVCKTLPRKSPLLKKVEFGYTAYGGNEDAIEEELSHNSFNVAYSQKQRKNVFEIRVFNGKLAETQEEAVEHYKRSLGEGEIFDVLGGGLAEAFSRGNTPVGSSQ